MISLMRYTIRKEFWGFKSMISIVIPVYNTPPSYIQRCLESIWEEKYGDIEIIIINDGSDDGACLEYLESVCSRGLSIYNQPNKGVSAARNLGIEKAKGEYIAFVDADDEIMGGFFHRASALALQYDLDIIFGSIRFIPDNGQSAIQGSKEFMVLQEQEIDEVKKSILWKKTGIFSEPVLGTPCARLYRASICRKIGFDEKIRICEDQIFNLYALNESLRVGIYPEYWYRYYQNQFSAMHNMKDRWDLFPYYEELKKYSVNCGNAEICKWIDIRLLGYMSGLLKQVACSKCKLLVKMKKIGGLARLPLFNSVIKKLELADREISVWKRTELVAWKCICILFKNKEDDIV